MRLQILAVTENGASKILPKCADTLRVLFIVPEIPDAPSHRNGRDRDLEIAERRRHLMSSLATGGI